MLRIDDLQVRYHDERPVLNGVNLNIDNDKIVIVGPNGSGKSTLLKAVLGLVPVSYGTISLFGRNCSR